MIEIRDDIDKDARKEILGQIESAEELGLENVRLAENRGSKSGTTPRHGRPKWR